MASWITVITLSVTSVVCLPARQSDGALFLTPLLKEGRIHEAQRLSHVEGDFTRDVVSHAGYITVDDLCESHLFFWFFPAQSNDTTAPVVLWLNGGPGATSLLGALVENGPLKITAEGEVVPSKVSWTEAFSMLYVDNPVGVGYSFTNRSSGLATTMDEIMPHLYSLLLQFFTIFPQYASNDLYVGGQSYAGVYMGAGFCDAQTMLPEFPESLFYAGLISDWTRQTFRDQLITVINKSLSAGQFDFRDVGMLFSGAANASENGDVNNMLGFKHSGNHLGRALKKFLSSPSTRQALHVDLANGKEDYAVHEGEVSKHLLPLNLFNDTNRENVFLMENYKVLHYSGNLDMVVSVAMTEAFLAKLQWSGAERYRTSIRYRWFTDTDMLGWVTTVGNFTRVVVRNAGHNTPYEQPEASLLMMKNFVFDQPFNTQVPRV